MKGAAGSGKSTIARSIAQTFKQEWWRGYALAISRRFKVALPRHSAGPTVWKPSAAFGMLAALKGQRCPAVLVRPRYEYAERCIETSPWWSLLFVDYRYSIQNTQRACYQHGKNWQIFEEGSSEIESYKRRGSRSRYRVPKSTGHRHVALDSMFHLRRLASRASTCCVEEPSTALLNGSRRIPKPSCQGNRKD